MNIINCIDCKYSRHDRNPPNRFSCIKHSQGEDGYGIINGLKRDDFCSYGEVESVPECKGVKRWGVEKCVFCGEIIPEGRQICKGCEK